MVRSSFSRQQDDQFVHWQNGLIGRLHLRRLGTARCLRDFKKEGAFLGGTTFKDGYEKVKSDWCSGNFQSFIAELLASGNADAVVHSRRPRGIRVAIIRPSVRQQEDSKWLQKKI